MTSIAAAAMYQHGQRLADIVDLRGPDYLDAMALQGKSYLAAINALSLVDQRNAWIQYVIPSGEGSRVSQYIVQVSPEARTEPTHLLYQRRHHHKQSIPEQHFQTASLDIDVVTLSEMKQEYALILATLQLFEEPSFNSSALDGTHAFMNGYLLRWANLSSSASHQS